MSSSIADRSLIILAPIAFTNLFVIDTTGPKGRDSASIIELVG